MVSTIAAVFLAAAVPTDNLSSVATAAYWYKKDERGKGDSISEQAKPRRFPAFAVGEDTFMVDDPLVRARHLDRIEIWHKGERVPAKEVARVEDKNAVVLKADRAVKGVKPLSFSKGKPVKMETWSWKNGQLTVTASGVGTNGMMEVVADTGRVFRKGRFNSLYLDKDGKPVWLDFGSRIEVPGGKFEYTPPSEWPRAAADSFEKAASEIEGRAASASLGVLLRLAAEEKEQQRRSFIVITSSSDSSNKNEIDAVGYVIGGKVVVPCDLGGDKIARLSKTEATFPDGTSTNLVFAGALAEWNALLFDIPGEFKKKVRPLEVAKGAAEDFDNAVAWSVSVENENGRIVADARRGRFQGVDFLRGAVFAPHVAGTEGLSSREEPSFILDAAGRVAVFALSRRFKASRWLSDSKEAVTSADLARFVAGEGVNPEFAPRKEEDRNRFVWLGVEAVRLTDALARERKAQSFMAGYSRPPYVTEVYRGSPAEKSGLKVGDILLAVRRGNDRERELESEFGYSSSTPWPDVENSINKLMSSFGAGAKVTLVYARDGKRHETPVVLETAPVHYQNAPKARNRSLGLSVRDMTFEVRRFFKFDDDASGIVIAKVKPGSPADVAGLDVYELVTEVNGEKVTSAKDFAAKIKGKTDLVFAVRRLAHTRIVKIHIEPDADKEKEKGGEKAK